MVRVERSTSKAGPAGNAGFLLPFAAVALSLAAAPGTARAASWADGDPYLAYGHQTYVVVVSTSGSQLYTVSASYGVDYAGHGAGIAASADPLNPVSKDFVVKGHSGGMARFTAGLASATPVWVKDFTETEGGCGMGDSMVWGPDGKIYRQHQ